MRMSVWEKIPYIYASLVIPETPFSNYGMGLLFDSTILLKESFVFNFGWYVHPKDDSIYNNSKDIAYMKINNIQKMINHIKTNKKITNHEILFIGRIIIRDYLTGIMCPECDEKTINKLKKTLDKNNFENIKIYTTSPFK
jgi:hypothetical protein